MSLCKALLLLLLLSSCAVKRDVSVPAQLYFPLIFNNYPRKLVGLGGRAYNLDVDWYYHWSISPSQTNERFVRMVWCLTDYHLAIYEPQVIVAARVDAHIGAQRVWLIMNEPDDNVHDIYGGQCGSYPITGNPLDPENEAPKVNESPAEMAVRYSAMYDLIKSNDQNALVFPAGVLQLSSTHTQWWWTTFVETLRERDELYKIDGVHVHLYPRWSTGECEGWCNAEVQAIGDSWYADYHVGLGLGDKPIWITEMGGAPFCSDYVRFDPQGWIDIRDNVMLPSQKWMETSPYDTAAWFVSWSSIQSLWWCGYLVDGQETLTPLGEAWTQ